MMKDKSNYCKQKKKHERQYTWKSEFLNKFQILTSSANRFPAPSIPPNVLVYVLHELAAKHQCLDQTHALEILGQLNRNSFAQMSYRNFLNSSIMIVSLVEKQDASNLVIHDIKPTTTKKFLLGQLFPLMLFYYQLSRIMKHQHKSHVPTEGNVL